MAHAPTRYAPTRVLVIVIAVAFTAAACSSSGEATVPVAEIESTTTTSAAVPTIPAPAADSAADRPAATSFPEPPTAVPTGPIDAEVQKTLNRIFSDPPLLDPATLRSVADSDDVRLAWELADLLRFLQGSESGDAAVEAFEKITGTSVDNDRAWRETNDLLLHWDLPVAPNHSARKAVLYTLVEIEWAPFFADPNADVDWRHITWGGVLIDGRSREGAALGQPCPGGCIPALNDPPVTDAAGGDWYPDEAVVFGLVVNGEARAFPKNQMEVHEMVNDTIGDRRIALTYCTLCGSAQAFFTDNVPGFDTLELRTSGLLHLSNKVMFDLDWRSMFDTFTGRAVTGPLHDGGITLEGVTVQTTTWADWKATHPGTTIVAEDGGIGSVYPANPLGGRDDDGPIFPIGRADDRLGVHDQVVGVATPDGSFVAFPVAAARATLDADGTVELAGIELTLDAGLTARTTNGDPVTSHQAFWFAWSQFHPDTELWLP